MTFVNIYLYKRKIISIPLKNLLLLIIREYKRIYEDDRKKRKPAAINGERLESSRAPSSIASRGKYGVWGHCLGDLHLNDVSYKESAGYYVLSIDS